jgi:hypothetical protein
MVGERGSHGRFRAAGLSTNHRPIGAWIEIEGSTDMTTNTRIAAIAMGLALALAGASASTAATTWQTHHPRRAEVNHRLRRQHHRVAVERREGDISRGQARDLHAEDRGVRAQERHDASRHHGHITRAEQRRLNAEENGVSNQIGR